MKAKSTKKTLKVAAVVAGMAAVLLIPTGCATSAASGNSVLPPITIG